MKKIVIILIIVLVVVTLIILNNLKNKEQIGKNDFTYTLSRYFDEIVKLKKIK